MAAPLHLDFVAMPPRSLLAWPCLLIGALLLALAAERYAGAEDELLQAERQLERMQRQHKQLLAGAASARGGKDARAQGQQREQKLLEETARGDWKQVLAAVEAALPVPVVATADAPTDAPGTAAVLTPVAADEKTADAADKAAKVLGPVALLNLNHEGGSRRLRLQAEARNIDDALAFAERLRKSGRFSEVVLGSHERRKSTGMDVLGFTLQASW